MKSFLFIIISLLIFSACNRQKNKPDNRQNIQKEIPTSREQEILEENKRDSLFSIYEKNDTNKNIKSNFEVNIESNKKIYLQLEPVWITVTIKNTGASIDSLIIYDKNEFLHQMFVKDSSGLPVIDKYPLVEYGNGKIIKLNSKEQVSFDVGLYRGFGDNKLLYLFSPFYYLSNGKYSVLLKFCDEPAHKIVTSNKTEFTVKQPQGNDLTVFEQLIELINSIDKKSPNSVEFAKGLKNIYDNNKKSIYSENILYNYLDKENFSNENLIEEFNNFFNKYPNSCYSDDLIRKLSFAYVKNLKKSEQELINLLNDIIKRYPNTKLSNSASNFLNDERLMNRLFRKKIQSN